MSKENVPQTAHVIASIAHDLRSPLNAVIGFSRIMLKGIDGPLSELQAADLEAIHTNGNTMLEMIDDVIDLAKAEAGRLTLSSTAVHLQPTLEKVLSLTGPDKEGQIELTYQPGEDVPPARADQVQVQKALERFVAVAMHFVKAGSIALTTEVGEESVTVKITGVASEGLSPDTPHILQAFHSSGTLPDQRVDATSLQMLVGKQLVALNGGTFWIEGPLDTRIVLALSLPLASHTHNASSDTT